MSVEGALRRAIWSQVQNIALDYFCRSQMISDGTKGASHRYSPQHVVTELKARYELGKSKVVEFVAQALLDQAADFALRNDKPKRSSYSRASGDFCFFKRCNSPKISFHTMSITPV